MNKYIFAILKNLTLMCGNYEFEDKNDELCYQLDTDVINMCDQFLVAIPESYCQSIKCNYNNNFVQRNYELLNAILKYMRESRSRSRTIYYSFLRLLRRASMYDLIEKLQSDKKLYKEIRPTSES